MLFAVHTQDCCVEVVRSCAPASDLQFNRSAFLAPDMSRGISILCIEVPTAYRVVAGVEQKI